MEDLITHTEQKGIHGQLVARCFVCRVHAQSHVETPIRALQVEEMRIAIVTLKR